MENVQTQNAKPPTTKAVENPKRHGFVLNMSICVITVAAVVVGVYLWQHREVVSVNAENKKLNSQLAMMKAQSESSQKVEPNSATKTDDQVSYKAGVGKFTLTLPSSYAIVRENDGGGEGGSYTSIGIGSKTSIGGVVDYSVHLQASIVGRPLHANETFRGLVDSDMRENTDAVKTIIKVDGVDAESYTFGGFGAPRSVYFAKNGIYYKLHTEEMDSAAGKLEPVIAGFKFD